MAEVEQKKVSYPYLGSSTWGELHRKLRASLPKKIDKDYLAVVLGVSEKGAANLIPQLKTCGLITEDGTPTDLANDFRDDQKYADACKAIVQLVYPSGLTDAVTDPPNQIEDAARWFRRQGTGEVAAKSQARFFAQLHDPVPPEAAKGKKDTPRASPSATRKPTKNPKTEAERSVQTPPAGDGGKPGVEHVVDQNSNRQNPSLHIDLQIHIASDASVDQIDALFASMAKHIYGR